MFQIALVEALMCSEARWVVNNLTRQQMIYMVIGILEHYELPALNEGEFDAIRTMDRGYIYRSGLDSDPGVPNLRHVFIHIGKM